MNEKLLVLERKIEQDIESINETFEALAGIELDRTTPEEQGIVVGYRLHNLYNAFENIFRSVASAFENSLDERAGWHSELLQRMRLDLMPIRPPVIDAAAFEKLDELRRFRHLFRSLYNTELDPVRMALALEKARELRELWRGQIGAFLGFVRGLSSSESEAR